MPRKTNDFFNLKQLALSETGFVFDPQTGNSYVANEVGLEIIKCLQKEMEEDEIIQYLLAKFDVDEDRLKKDYEHFLLRLVQYGLIQENDLKR
jgi:PqqD family protein of HPr-rel-A system